MKPIKAPTLATQGIAVYVPSVNNYSQAKIEIFYSAKNPLFSWSFCSDSPYKIWEKLDYQYGNGVLFVYNSPTILPKGFYKIQITVMNNNGELISGNLTLGLLEAKQNLHIGLPYSTYAPITLS